MIALLSMACTRPEPPSPVETAETAETAESGAPPDTAPVGSTGSTADTGESPGGHLYPLVPYDCAAGVPPGPFTPGPVVGVRTTEDFAIDPAGWLYASDSNQNLVRFSSDGTGEVFVPSFADTRGLDLLPDGGLVLSNETVAQLTRVDLATRASTSLAPIGSSPSAIDVASDGTVYVGDLATGRVYEVAPDGTVRDLWSSSGPFVQTYGIVLSLDERTLFVSQYNGATVFRLRKGDDGAWGPAEPWVEMPVSALGGMVLDACDNVYLVATARCDVFRLSPDAVVEQIADNIPGPYCANLAFGRDVGGWDPYALYVSTYDVVAKLDIGVPGRPR